MDWNWFFSSVSQSTAAIVGIFGAFIITKIMANQASFSQRNTQMRDLATTARKLAERSGGLYFHWYNKYTDEYEYKKIEKLLGSGCEDSAAAVYEKLHFSDFSDRNNVVSQIEKILEARRERQRKEREEARKQAEEAAALNKKLGIPFPAAHIRSMSEDFAPIMSSELQTTLQNERESINEVLREVRHHIRKISDFKEAITGNPESSPQITYSLVIVFLLFCFGVIYPLSFMPLPIGVSIELSLAAFFDILFSIRGFLLATVSVLFSTILAMFFVMNVRMKYSPVDTAELYKFCSLSAYSQYFEVLERNLSNVSGRGDG